MRMCSRISVMAKAREVAVGVVIVVDGVLCRLSGILIDVVITFLADTVACIALAVTYLHMYAYAAHLYLSIRVCAKCQQFREYIIGNPNIVQSVPFSYQTLKWTLKWEAYWTLPREIEGKEGWMMRFIE